MANINPDSSEWKAVKAFIKSEREDALTRLIADESSEQQRGILRVLDKLKDLAKPAPEPVITDTYN